MFHHKYFSYFCFNYFDLFINVFSRIYFFLCLMFKHFCPNNFNLLRVFQKLVYTLHFPVNWIFCKSAIYTFYLIIKIDILILVFLSFCVLWMYALFWILDCTTYYLIHFFCKSSFNLYISLFFPVYHRF